jgi:c(7)-type cytochrome triheme protein
MQRKCGVAATVGLCLSLWAVVVFWSTSACAQTKPGESVVKFDNDKMKESGPAEFSHPGHKAAFGQEKLDCKPCHTNPPPLFQMKKRAPGEARATMADMKQGKSCGKCHDGKTTINGKVAFAADAKENCGKCHKK